MGSYERQSGEEMARQMHEDFRRTVEEHLRDLHVQAQPEYVNGSPSDEGNYVFVTHDEELPAYSNEKRTDDKKDDETPTSSSASFVPSVATEWTSNLLADPRNRLALSALSNNPVPSILTSTNALVHDAQTFNVRIPHEGSPVTNQRASGRCWLFASTNVFRVAIMQTYDLASFELSQAYLFYWDKLEKANYFLESILETTEEPLDSRLLQSLLAGPVGDGGQWDMVANLVAKYGLVPQSLYPDSFHAKNSGALSSTLTRYLRSSALQLRNLAKSLSTDSSKSPSQRLYLLRERKATHLKTIHQILTLLLGPPPPRDQKFTWEYYTKSGSFRSLTTTPKSFASSLHDTYHAHLALGGTDVRHLFSLVHDPRHDPYTLLTVDRLGNVRGGRPVTYVNTPLPQMKSAVLAMLRKGFPVFFGCDVGKYLDQARGIMDTGLLDYELGFNVNLGLDSKADRLRTGESAMTHAMVITAAHVSDEGVLQNSKNRSAPHSKLGVATSKNEQIIRWRVENSWSESAGDKGYFVMTDAWFDEFVFQAVVDPGMVGKKVKDVLKSEATVLPLWDPMGALA